MTPARRAGRIPIFLNLLGLAIAAAAATSAQARSATPPAEPRAASEAAQVLVITGSDPYLPAFVAIDAAMRQAVARRQRPVQWLHESTDTLRFGARPGPQFAELLARKFEGIRIDAVVIVTEQAVNFYLQEGRSLWPHAPVIINSIAADYAHGLLPGSGITAIPAELDFAGTLRTAFELQPRTRRILVIAGTSPSDQQQLADARRALARFAGRVEIEYLIGRDQRAVTERLAQDAPETIALYVGVFADASGRVYVPRNFLQEIAAVSRVPIYGVFETYLGSGVVAGSIEPLSARGRLTGEVLLKALDGEPMAGPVVLPVPASTCMADARQLARFGLARSRLPEGCEVRYVEPTFLQRYWWQSLLVALVLIGQSILIASLLIQRELRRRAEAGLQAQRVQLLHAARLAVAGELTASIAHEINQPLGAILSNADAAEILVQTGRLERDELLQILSDIKRDDLRASEVIRRLRALLARHDAEHQRLVLDVAVEDAAQIVRGEGRRRGFTVETVLDANDAAVLGDPVQLQQVFVNLVLNAFDAGAGLPPDRRRVRIGTVSIPLGVQVSVRDYGNGIAAADLPRLFDPFFTTKPTGMGLGLSIARSIVEAHGGTIAAGNRDPGAEFTVTLPRAPSPGPAEAE